jgi:hypothetical protein
MSISDIFYFFVWVAIFATGMAIWTVGFSRLWRDDAKRFLAQTFGAGPNDDEISEAARQQSAKFWIVISALCWVCASATMSGARL